MAYPGAVGWTNMAGSVFKEGLNQLEFKECYTTFRSDPCYSHRMDCYLWL